MLYKSLLIVLLSFFYFSVFSQTDTIPPNAYCFYGIRWIVNTEQDSISIDTFVAKDQYSPEELKSLRFSFSSDVNDTIWRYNCDHGLIGVTAVEVWVTDQQGNQSFCETFASIGLGNSCNPPCPGYYGDVVPVQLQITTLKERNLSDVKIDYYANNMLCSSYFTDHTGYARVRYYGINRFSINKEIKSLNGVSTLDVILIVKHVLGIDPINSPLELLSADIDDSGDITMEDAQLLSRIIRGNESIERLQWKFVPKRYRFSNWTNPFIDDLSNFESLWEKAIYESYGYTYHTIAIKTGDVNGSYNPGEN